MIINGELDLNNCQNLKDLSRITEIKGELILPGFDTDKNIKLNPNLKVKTLTFNSQDWDNKNTSYIFPKINFVEKLDLSEHGNLNKIPKGINVNTLKLLDISWTNISELSDMPNLEEFICIGCKDLSTFPNTNKPMKSISIYGTKINKLPKLSPILNSLEIGSTEIRELPKELNILKDCNISNLELKELPNKIKIGGKLIADRNQFLKFPKDIEVGKFITIEGCYNLEYVPDNLKVIPFLGGCRSLKRIPKQLITDKQTLFDNHFSGIDIDFGDCESIENLGTLKRLEISLFLRNCYSLKTFSQLEYVNGNINAENCKNLSYILKLKKVNGDLKLLDCKSLKTLGQLEYVKGDLNLRNCNNLNLLPNNLKVSGKIIVSQNNKIKNLNKFKDKIQIYEIYSKELYKKDKNKWRKELGE